MKSTTKTKNTEIKTIFHYQQQEDTDILTILRDSILLFIRGEVEKICEKS